jgi:chromosome segregation ATPase
MKKTSKMYSEDQVVTILEDIKDQFGAFGEGLTIVSEGQERLEKRFDGLEKKVDRLEIRFDGLETRFDGLETRFDGLEKKVGEIDARLISVQDDVMEIKHKLSEKVDLADFQKLEKRMVKLEKLVLSTR